MIIMIKANLRLKKCIAMSNLHSKLHITVFTALSLSGVHLTGKSISKKCIHSYIVINNKSPPPTPPTLNPHPMNLALSLLFSNCIIMENSDMLVLSFIGRGWGWWGGGYHKLILPDMAGNWAHSYANCYFFFPRCLMVQWPWFVQQCLTLSLILGLLMNSSQVSWSSNAPWNMTNFILNVEVCYFLNF